MNKLAEELNQLIVGRVAERKTLGTINPLPIMGVWVRIPPRPRFERFLYAKISILRGFL